MATVTVIGQRGKNTIWRNKMITVETGLPQDYGIEDITVKQDLDPRLIVIEQGKDTIILTKKAVVDLINALMKL